MPEQAADQPEINKPSQSTPPPPVESAEPAETVDNEALLRQELEATRQKAEDNWQLALRSKAELENLRKRTQRDIENAHKYGLERMAAELLAVRDSMELGLNTAKEGVEDLDGLKEGLSLTLKMLIQLMQKFGITEINPENEKFDPGLHQAITMQESARLEPNTVISVLQKGYRLQDRLLRPALVTVAKPPEKNQKQNGDNP
jgi:molecular chaperone GrpE